MDDSFPYIATFAAKVWPLTPSETELKEAKASLTDLKGLLPNDINPEADADLLYAAANLAVAGMVNLNDDGLDVSTALQVYKKFEKKQVNIEHDRERIVGFILKAGLSEVGTDRIITEEEARESNKPFNICTVAVLWRLKAPELCDYIEDASDPLSPDYKSLSLSFEMGFRDYAIASMAPGEMDISKAKKIVTPVDADFEQFSAALRSNKGSGLAPDNTGYKVYRIMPASVVPLGQGIVSQPAAAVKGIIAVTAPVNNDKTMEVVQMEDQSLNNLRSEIDKVLTLCQKSNDDSIISAKSSVFQYIQQVITLFNNMKNPDLEKIQERAAKAQKPEDFQEVFASFGSFAEILMAESEKRAEEAKKAKEIADNLEKSNQEAKAKHEQVMKDFEALQTKLTELERAQASAEAQQLFDQRMNNLSEIFDLESDADVRAFFAEEIRTCENDEAFAKKVDKFKKIMKEKMKKKGDDKKDDGKKDDSKKDDGDDDDKAEAKMIKAALEAKGFKVTMSENGLDFTEILASAKDNVTSTHITNSIETRTSLKDQAREAFKDVTIGGKKLSQLAKKE